MPSAFVQDNEYVLDGDNESVKEDEDKGNAENEEEFETLSHSDLPVVIEWYSFKNRIKQSSDRDPPESLTASEFKALKL